MIGRLVRVPRGTVVQVSVRLPARHGVQGDGFRWEATADMTAEAARDDVARKLFRRFLDQFLPAD